MPTLQDLLQKADSCKQKIASARPPEDCREAAGHGAAYDFMLELARQPDMDITEDIIRNLHRLLYQKADTGQAGQYRTIEAGLSGTGHIPPSPEDIPRLMNHLADQIHSSRSTLHPIELAAMAHKRLVDISPFADGNGRTAWLLMNLILVNAGYGVASVPPIRRDDYDEALSASRRLLNMEPFSKLIAECVVESEQDLFRRLQP